MPTLKTEPQRTDIVSEARELLPKLFAKPDDLETLARAPKVIKALIDKVEGDDLRIVELERRLRIPFGALPCAQCGGPHDFDTSIPSVVWNSVIRARGLPDYLCTTCIVREFVRAGQGFTAELWNEEFNGVNIEVVVNGQNAKDASAVQEENNSLRNERSELQSRLVQVEKERDNARRHGRVEGLKEADQVSCTAGAIRERIKLLESQP